MKRVLISFNRKIKGYNELVKSGELDDFDKKQFNATKASYFGHFNHSDFFRINKVLSNSILCQ